jgi:methylase of polypeptide subunit release factors
MAVTLTISTDQIREVAKLISAKPMLLETVFSEDRSGYPDKMGLTDSECDLLVDVGFLSPARGLYRPRYRLSRERANALVTRDFARREHDVAESEPNRPIDRVFPWSDEADQTYDYVTGQYEQLPLPSRVLNMCCGSGAIALSLTRHWSEQRRFKFQRVLGVDLAEHAIRRSEFNRLLNLYDDHPVADLIKFDQANLCATLTPDDLFDLIVGDPPYSLHPKGHTASGFHGGGELGIGVVQRFLEQCGQHLAPGGRLICQCYSLGTFDEPTLLQEVVATSLGLSADEARQSVHKMPWKVWRFRDSKCFQPPMPVEYMVARCADRTYTFYKQFQESPEEEMRKYVQWIEDIKNPTDPAQRGYTHIHYVVINYQRPARKSRSCR